MGKIVALQGRRSDRTGACDLPAVLAGWKPALRLGVFGAGVYAIPHITWDRISSCPSYRCDGADA
jgi:hypothetical protein